MRAAGASRSALLRDGRSLDELALLPGKHLERALAVHDADPPQSDAQPARPLAHPPLVCPGARAQGKVAAMRTDLEPRRESVCLPPSAAAAAAAVAH